ncbi:MAG: translesion DNA synthesis-associated protein ImuA [Ideonella sp.]|nr:translesion DNA synthesis-associated protein ImuA [Ideonella sp.]
MVWRARAGGAGGRAPGDVWPTGWPSLDAELPGGGWPGRALTELLLPAPGLGELRLLAPLLARLSAQGQSLLWVQPPALLSAPSLLQMGCAPERCVVVQPALAPPRRAVRKGAPPAPWADLCWVLEQALRSGQVGVVMAWLPEHLPPEALRRLQLAAQSQAGPVFLWRPASDAAQASPAPLRLRLQAAGPDVLAVTGLKRRGPSWTQPLLLPLPAVLSARGLVAAQAWAEDADATQARGPLSAQRLRQRANAAVRSPSSPPGGLVPFGEPAPTAAIPPPSVLKAP